MTITAEDLLTEWHNTASDDLASPHLNRAAAALHAGDRTGAAEELELAASHRRDGERLCRMAAEIQLGWRYNPDELRNEHGEWTRTGGEVSRAAGSGYLPPDHARLINPRGTPHDPADHPFFKQHPVTPGNVIASYDRTPAPLRQQGMRWYADAHTVAKAIAGGDAEKGSVLLSAYSPQSAWPVNMFNAARAVDLGRAIGPGEGMITGSMQANAQKAFDGDTVEQALHSPKTRSFGRLIRNGGDTPDDTLGDVVIDRHAMSVAMGVRLPKAAADKAPIGTERYYQYVADQYRLAAQRISRRDGIQVSPHQLQAITWLQQQDENDAVDAADTNPVTERLAHGRATMIGHAWQHWQAESQADRIPVHAGTTTVAAANTITGQLDLSWRDAWRHELRGPHGEWVKSPVAEALRADGSALSSLRTPDGNWVHDNKALQEASTGRKAGNVRLHDTVLYAKTIPVPFGLGMDLRPMEVTSLHHHWEGHGRTPSGRARRTRYTDWTLHDPETGEDFEESIKDGVSVKMFPREQVRAAAGAHPAPPSPPPAPFPGPSFVRDPVPTAPPPVPAPAPPVLSGKHYGTVQFGGIGEHPEDVVADPATRAAVSAEVQHGLDLQARFIPKIASRQVVTVTRDLVNTSGTTLGEADRDSDEIRISPDDAAAVGDTTRAIDGITPAQLLARDEGSGWWTPSDPQYSLMDRTVAHEEGHVVADKVSRQAMLSPDLWDKMAEAIGVPPPDSRRDIISGKRMLDVPSWVGLSGDQIKPAVSEYGTRNLNELQAELWAEYTMNAHPRPPAKVYGDYITAQLKAAGKLGDVTGPLPVPAARPPVAATPKISAAEKKRLSDLWASATRYTATYHNAKDPGSQQEGDAFAHELHRLLTTNTPPSADDAGTRDAHAFLAMVDRYATRQDDEIDRGIDLDPAVAEGMFKPGATIDLPVASWSTLLSKAHQFMRMSYTPGQTRVLLHTAPGAKGMNLTHDFTEYGVTKKNKEAEVVTGGRYSVDSIEQVGTTMNVYLTQQDFSAH